MARGKPAQKTIKQEKKESVKTYCIARVSDVCDRNDGYRVEANYYTTTNPMFKNGRVSICKDCMYQLVFDKTQKGDIFNVVKFKKMLPFIDKPFLDEVYQSVKYRVENKNRS